MYKNLEMLNEMEHRNNSVKEIKDFSYAKNLTNVPITVDEFFEACKNYPIFFAKDKNDNWFASVMLGFKENENIFVDEKGNWKKLHYVPAFVRKYPFVLIDQGNDFDFLIGIDKEYLITNKEDNSRKLFDEKSNNEFLNKIVMFLINLKDNLKITSNLIKQLEEWELLEEKIEIQFNLTKFYVVNEEKLKFFNKGICSKDMMLLITAHLTSLSNIQKLGIK